MIKLTSTEDTCVSMWVNIFDIFTIREYPDRTVLFKGEGAWDTVKESADQIAAMINEARRVYAGI